MTKIEVFSGRKLNDCTLVFCVQITVDVVSPGL